MRRTISRALLVAIVAGTLVAAGASGTASAAASKCTRAESQLRVTKKRLNRDRATLKQATRQARLHPRSPTAKRNLARAKLRVRADNQSLKHRRQTYEQLCLPGY